MDSPDLGEGFHHGSEQTRFVAPGAPTEQPLRNVLTGPVAVIVRASPEPGREGRTVDAATAVCIEIWTWLAGFLVKREVG